nr:hypothetical protein [Tanacetum cinerariifolium]
MASSHNNFEDFFNDTTSDEEEEEDEDVQEEEALQLNRSQECMDYISSSEPSEMAPKSSRAVVVPKFDMHIYTSELTSTELKDAISEYCIPIDLHPRLPHPGWKKKFFLLDRQAIPDAMPWRHSDTDLHDDFPTHFNEDDFARLSECQVPLCPPPRHLLYMYGLTTACRHLVLQYHIKDHDKNVISMDTFLKLPTWTGTVVSKGDPLSEDHRPKPRPNPKIVAAREKKDQQSLARVEAKRAGPPQVKKEVVDLSGNTRMSSSPVIDVPPLPHQEHHDTHEIHSQSSYHGSEDEPVGNRYVPNWRLHNDLRVCTFHACKELVSHLATLAEDEFFGALSNVEVISRAYQTLRQSVVAQGELLKRHEQLNHDYEDRAKERGFENKLSLIESAHSGCGSQEKELADLVKDLERDRDEWRVTASNQVEQIRALEKDLEPKTYQLETAEERIRVLEGDKRALSAELARSEIDRQKLVREFIPSVVRRLHTSVEYRKALAVSVSLCYTAWWLGGISLGRSEEEIARLLAETKDLDIKGSKSWETKHIELFAKQYPYVHKVADSYLLPMADLLRVSLDVPAPRPTAKVPDSTGEQAGDTDPRLPPPHHEITEDTPFGTTT